MLRRSQRIASKVTSSLIESDEAPPSSPRQPRRRLSTSSATEEGPATPRQTRRRLSISSVTEDAPATPGQSHRRLSTSSATEEGPATPRQSLRRLSTSSATEEGPATPRQSRRRLSTSSATEEAPATPRQLRRRSRSDSESEQSNDVTERRTRRSGSVDVQEGDAKSVAMPSTGRRKTVNVLETVPEIDHLSDTSTVANSPTGSTRSPVKSSFDAPATVTHDDRDTCDQAECCPSPGGRPETESSVHSTRTDDDQMIVLYLDEPVDDLLETLAKLDMVPYPSTVDSAGVPVASDPFASTDAINAADSSATCDAAEAFSSGNVSQSEKRCEELGATESQVYGKREIGKAPLTRVSSCSADLSSNHTVLSPFKLSAIVGNGATGLSPAVGGAESAGGQSVDSCRAQCASSPAAESTVSPASERGSSRDPTYTPQPVSVQPGAAQTSSETCFRTETPKKITECSPQKVVVDQVETAPSDQSNDQRECDTYQDNQLLKSPSQNMKIRNGSNRSSGSSMLKKSKSSPKDVRRSLVNVESSAKKRCAPRRYSAPSGVSSSLQDRPDLSRPEAAESDDQPEATSEVACHRQETAHSPIQQHRGDGEVLPEDETAVDDRQQQEMGAIQQRKPISNGSHRQESVECDVSQQELGDVPQETTTVLAPQQDETQEVYIGQLGQTSEDDSHQGSAEGVAQQQERRNSSNLLAEQSLSSPFKHSPKKPETESNTSIRTESEELNSSNATTTLLVSSKNNDRPKTVASEGTFEDVISESAENSMKSLKNTPKKRLSKSPLRVAPNINQAMEVSEEITFVATESFGSEKKPKKVKKKSLKARQRELECESVDTSLHSNQSEADSSRQLSRESVDVQDSPVAVCQSRKKRHLVVSPQVAAADSFSQVEQRPPATLAAGVQDKTPITADPDSTAARLKTKLKGKKRAKQQAQPGKTSLVSDDDSVSVEVGVEDSSPMPSQCDTCVVALNNSPVTSDLVSPGDRNDTTDVEKMVEHTGSLTESDSANVVDKRQHPVESFEHNNEVRSIYVPAETVGGVVTSLDTSHDDDPTSRADQVDLTSDQPENIHSGRDQKKKKTSKKKVKKCALNNDEVTQPDLTIDQSGLDEDNLERDCTALNSDEVNRKERKKLKKKKKVKNLLSHDSVEGVDESADPAGVDCSVNLTENDNVTVEQLLNDDVLPANGTEKRKKKSTKKLLQSEAVSNTPVNGEELIPDGQMIDEKDGHSFAVSVTAKAKKVKKLKKNKDVDTVENDEPLPGSLSETTRDKIGLNNSAVSCSVDQLEKPGEVRKKKMKRARQEQPAVLPNVEGCQKPKKNINTGGDVLSALSQNDSTSECEKPKKQMKKAIQTSVLPQSDNVGDREESVKENEGTEESAISPARDSDSSIKSKKRKKKGNQVTVISENQENEPHVRQADHTDVKEGIDNAADATEHVSDAMVAHLPEKTKKKRRKFIEKTAILSDPNTINENKVKKPKGILKVGTEGSETVKPRANSTVSFSLESVSSHAIVDEVGVANCDVGVASGDPVFDDDSDESPEAVSFAGSRQVALQSARALAELRQRDKLERSRKTAERQRVRRERNAQRRQHEGAHCDGRQSSGDTAAEQQRIEHQLTEELMTELEQSERKHHTTRQPPSDRGDKTATRKKRFRGARHPFDPLDSLDFIPLSGGSVSRDGDSGQTAAAAGSTQFRAACLPGAEPMVVNGRAASWREDMLYGRHVRRISSAKFQRLKHKRKVMSQR